MSWNFLMTFSSTRMECWINSLKCGKKSSCFFYLKTTSSVTILLMNLQGLQFIKAFMSTLDLEWITTNFYFLFIKRYRKPSEKSIKPNCCFLNLVFLMSWEDFMIHQVNNHLKDLMLSVIIPTVHLSILMDQTNANFLIINTLKWDIKMPNNSTLDSQSLNLEVLLMRPMTWQK